MNGFTPAQILGHRFPETRRNGYDMLAVDRFLEDLAEHVGALRSQVDVTVGEPTAQRVLADAQQVAGEIVRAARSEAEAALAEAERVRRESEAQAARMIASAQRQAQRLIDRSFARVQVIESDGQNRVRDLDRTAEDLRRFIDGAAVDLRSKAQQMETLADSLRCEPPAQRPGSTGAESGRCRS